MWKIFSIDEKHDKFELFWMITKIYILTGRVYVYIILLACPDVGHKETFYEKNLSTK